MSHVECGMCGPVWLCLGYGLQLVCLVAGLSRAPPPPPPGVPRRAPRVVCARARVCTALCTLHIVQNFRELAPPCPSVGCARPLKRVDQAWIHHPGPSVNGDRSDDKERAAQAHLAHDCMWFNKRANSMCRYVSLPPIVPSQTSILLPDALWHGT